jgi:O-acetyl-ADP-ribose deacetylase (regulator of RNase III)
MLLLPSEYLRPTGARTPGKTMKDIRIEIIKGDITESETDAIVNTANNLLILGSGLAGAIKAKGGPGIAEECAKKGPAEIGEAVLTKGGRLKTRHIIHAVLSEFDGRITEESIRKGLMNALRLADKNAIRSIAIPDMGVGIVSVPPERSARLMIAVLKEFLKGRVRSLERVEIVLRDVESLRVFKDVYAGSEA